jgi:hypothetical protein
MHSCMPQQLHHNQIKLVYAICHYGSNNQLCHSICNLYSKWKYIFKLFGV